MSDGMIATKQPKVVQEPPKVVVEAPRTKVEETPHQKLDRLGKEREGLAKIDKLHEEREKQLERASGEVPLVGISAALTTINAGLVAAAALTGQVAFAALLGVVAVLYAATGVLYWMSRRNALRAAGDAQADIETTRREYGLPAPA